MSCLDGNIQKIVSREWIVAISMTNNDYEYINNHVIDDRNLFPATIYIYVWQTLGIIVRNFSKFKIIIRDAIVLKDLFRNKFIGGEKLKLWLKCGYQYSSHFQSMRSASILGKKNISNGKIIG
ncbi:fatty acid synthase-like [Vespula maculifrons]|uniref:Fatty acid synthase-like n=1 Tax=Vespula maculifrons TaxID=7453 RepID=A0ABD2CJS7_VESMC